MRRNDGKADETSPPTIPASGRGRRRASGAVRAWPPRKPSRPAPSPWWCRCRPAARWTPTRAWSPSDADVARPAGRDRERDRRVGHNRRRPRRACDARRLHHRLRSQRHARVNAAVYKLNYDVVTDFEPIALIGNTPWLIAARKAFPANDLRGLIAWLKANPDKASSGTAGPGSPSHIGGVLFQNVTGTRFQLIPYKGTAPSIPDLVSGNLDMAILDPITSLPQFRGGRIKIFAAMAKDRTAMAPDIPTVDEAGAPGVYVEPWQAMFAPKGTPKDVIAKLNGAVVSALDDPAVRKRIRGTELRGYGARESDAGIPRQIPPGRDREMVADHQGGRHQGGVNRSCNEARMVRYASSRSDSDSRSLSHWNRPSPR